jgi:hypothetical protein
MIHKYRFIIRITVTEPWVFYDNSKNFLPLEADIKGLVFYVVAV